MLKKGLVIDLWERGGKHDFRRLQLEEDQNFGVIRIGNITNDPSCLHLSIGRSSFDGSFSSGIFTLDGKTDG